jgi:4a-hydroxytetrahydrobiopterin dehydratase
MSTIKKFESFESRMPEEVTMDECLRKLEIHGREQFTQKERNFFTKLRRENINCDIDSGGSNTELTTDRIGNCVIIKFHPEDDKKIRISISKLKDYWYLIWYRITISTEHDYRTPRYDTYDSYYICDEWDELFEFLENRIEMINKITIPKDWNGTDKISKEFTFKNFNQAWMFVKKVAELSEEMYHHPEINWNYTKVKLTLFTHNEGKVTKKDTNLAKKIDEIKL